jgi:hypothetical protein
MSASLLTRMRRVNNDEATKAIVYEGATVNQLSAMFNMTKTEVSKRIRTLPPSGIRSGYPIYKVHEAAPYLVQPKADVEEYVRKMGVRDLPPTLQKDLWAAMNGQLKFEQSQGMVWRVERIQEVWSEWHKRIRMTLLIAPDDAEREGRLPPEFYEWFREFIDRLLLGLHQEVTSVLSQMPEQPAGVVEYVEDDGDGLAPVDENISSLGEDDDGI